MNSLILYGKRFTELQKWRNLKLLQNTSVFSTSFSTDLSIQNGRKGKTFTVKYLVESLGLTTKLAESISSKENPSSVLNLLRKFGFTDSQISRIITIYPRLLTLDAEKSLLPKLQSLQSREASSLELTDIVSKVPKILAKRGAKATGLYFDFIKDIIQQDKEEEIDNKSSKSEKVCNHTSVKQRNKIRNISVLRELGVPQRFLFTLLISGSQPVCGKEKFEKSVKKVVEMGFDPTTSRFVQALHVVYEMSEKTIEDKFNVYTKLGFDVNDVWEMFNKWPYSLKFSEKKITLTFESLKKFGLMEEEVISVMKKRPECMRASKEKITNCVETFRDLGFSSDEFVLMIKCFPTCIGLSSESVKKKIEFLVNDMNWSLKDIVVVPPALGYSLEKRIVPRCNVIKALMSKGSIDGIPPMSSVLASSNEIFLNRFVMKHKKMAPKLMAIFNGNKVQSLSRRKKNVKA